MSSADNICKELETRSGSRLFDTLKVLLKDFFEKVDFEKKSADDKKHAGTELTNHSLTKMHYVTVVMLILMLKLHTL